GRTRNSLTPASLDQPTTVKESSLNRTPNSLTFARSTPQGQKTENRVHFSRSKCIYFPDELPRTAHASQRNRRKSMDSTTLCPPAPLETKMVSAPATEHPKDARPKPNSTSEPGTCAAPLCGPRKRVRTMVLGLGLAAGLGCVLAFWYP